MTGVIPDLARRSLFLVALLCGGGGAGCAPGAFTLKITVDPAANNNYPVMLSVLVIYDKALVTKLQEINARQWFAQRDQFLRDYGKRVSEDFFEFVPGQPVNPVERTLKVAAAGGLVYANYRSPGTHRYTFDPTRTQRVTLGPKGVNIDDLDPPKKGALKLPTELPTEAPEAPDPGALKLPGGG